MRRPQAVSARPHTVYGAGMPGDTLHPELRTVARFLPRGVGGPGAMRISRALLSLTSRRRPPRGVTVEPLGTASVRVHRPPATEAAPHPGLLWIHGGGYIQGSPAQDDRFCSLVASRLGAVVAAVEYRKAPEHPYPAAIEDCHDGLVWLSQQPDVDPARIAVGGASAGGGLAAALAIYARRQGRVAPAFQLLVYPMLDDRTALRDDIDETNFRLWNIKSNRFGWRSYLGREPGSPGVTGTEAAAREEDLAGLPPAWIGVGTCDLFLDEDRAYAERLQRAGVPVCLHEEPGAFHGFDAIRPGASPSRRFRAAQMDALAAAFAPS